MSGLIAKSYRNASIPIDSDKMQKREAGLNNYIRDNYSEEDIEDLTRLFFSQKCDKDFLDIFTEVFHEEDDIFADDQIQELQVLAGIALNKICEIEEENDRDDDLFQIKVYVNSYFFIGKIPVINDIYENIQRIYEKKTAERRDNINFGYRGIFKMPKEVSFPVKEGQVYEISGKDTDTFISMINKINALCSVVNNNFREQTERNKILYENTEFLWWLLTGYSNDENKAYSELSDKLAALLAGKDLAGIVQSKPGPYLVKNLLNKALGENGRNKYSLKEYIDICNDRIIEKMLEEETDEIHTPVLYALYKKMENGEGNWIKAFEKKFGHSDLTCSCIEIAYQIYLECLLLKW